MKAPLLPIWEIFWVFGKVIWKIPSDFQKALLLTLNWGSDFEGVFQNFLQQYFPLHLLWIRGAVWQGVLQNFPQKYFSLHLLWIRGAFCGGVFEKILKYFSIRTQKEAQPTDFSEGCASQYTIHFLAVTLIYLLLLFAIFIVELWLPISPKS